MKCGGKEEKERKRERIAVFFLLSQVFNFVFLLQLSLPSSLSFSLPQLLTLVLRQKHVRDPFLHRKLPPRLGADQRSLDQAHLEQGVVERLQEAVVAQVLLRGRGLLQGGEQPREAAASASAPHSRRGSMSRRKSGSKSASMVSTCERQRKEKESRGG